MKREAVKTWPTSMLILAIGMRADVRLHPFGSNEVLSVEWPDGRGGSVRFRRDDVGEWFEAVAEEIDRRFPGGSP